MISGFSLKCHSGINPIGIAAVFSGAFLFSLCGITEGANRISVSASGVQVKPIPENNAESDVGFATSNESKTLRGQNTSLLDNLSFMFKKEEEKSPEGEEQTDSEPKLIQRRPLAERLETESPDESSASEEEIVRNLADLSSEELLQEGDAAYNDGDFDSALDCYSELIARTEAADGIDEQLVVPYHRLGVIERERKEYLKAQEYLVLAIKSDPSKDPQITFDYALILFENGKFERAKKLFSYLEEKCPEMTDVHRYLGLCLMNIDPEDPEAFTVLEAAVGLQEACTLIREKCLAEGKTEKAEEMAALINQTDSGDAEPCELSDNSVVSLGGNPLPKPEREEGLLDLESVADDGSISVLDKGIAGLDQDQTTHINSPLINLETLGPKQIMVGQESEYRILVENKSNEVARNLIVRTEIPENVEITSVNASVGASHIGGNESGNALVCFWNLGEYDPGAKGLLVFKFISRTRENINFMTTYDVDKTFLNSGITVTEPKLELILEGSDTIEWGAVERYRLKIRNSGDGDAQNIRLTVSTGDNDNATRILKKLAPGEEKQLELNMKTVLDNVLVINAEAEADYGFTAQVEKSVDILRGNLDLFVEVPEVQFVNDIAEYNIHICNTGRAELSNVEVVAAIPTSIEVVSVTGNPIENEPTSQIVWTIPSIKPEEEILYQVNTKMLRAGFSRVDVTAADKTGVSSFGNAQIQVEAIAALEMKINKPTGAIATGKEVKYEVVIANNGTKAAEMIDAGFFLPSGMVPVSVDGGGKVIADESKVLFNKINFLGPGQTVVYTVHAVAEERGNHKVQAVLESKEDNVQLVSEEMNFFYDKKPSLAQKNTLETGSQDLAMTVNRPTSTQNTLKVANRSDENKTDFLPESNELGSSSAASALPGPRTVK